MIFPGFRSKTRSSPGYGLAALRASKAGIPQSTSASLASRSLAPPPLSHVPATAGRLAPSRVGAGAEGIGGFEDSASASGAGRAVV
jgi:hypothetical protein